jgi:hypothetical protein
MHFIGTSGAVLKACSSVEGNLHSHTPPTLIITDHVFPLSLLATHPDSIWDCVHVYSTTLYPKRANLSANCGVPYSSKVFGCWTISLPGTVQFSSILFSQIIFRRFRKTAQSYYKLRRVYICPSVSVRMKQLGSHRTDFNGI